MTSVITVFFLTRKCDQFSNDLLTFLTEEKQMKSNSSFNNSHTQIKVLEILFEKKSNNLGKYLNTNLYNRFIFIIIYSASVAGEETLHTYSYVQSHIKDIRWRIKT